MYFNSRKIRFKPNVVPAIQYAISDAALVMLAFKMDYTRIKQAIKFQLERTNKVHEMQKILDIKPSEQKRKTL